MISNYVKVIQGIRGFLSTPPSVPQPRVYIVLPCPPPPAPTSRVVPRSALVFACLNAYSFSSLTLLRPLRPLRRLRPLRPLAPYIQHPEVVHVPPRDPPARRHADLRKDPCGGKLSRSTWSHRTQSRTSNKRWSRGSEWPRWRSSKRVHCLCMVVLTRPVLYRPPIASHCAR